MLRSYGHTEFAVAVFVSTGDQVLLVHHKKLNQWLPVGGHIEPGETPEHAAIRETKEESGLTIKLLGRRPPALSPNSHPLIAPTFMDIHRISDDHYHICLVYFAVPVSGMLTWAPAEHYSIRWHSLADLDLLTPPIDPMVKWYCYQAAQETRMYINTHQQ
jgi:8-oxo-dGTP pyrophosphatase MutT (NUDIX family)